MVREAISECSGCPLAMASPGRCVFIRASYPAGHVFFHQGDDPQAAHFISRGIALLTEYDTSGGVARQILRSTGSLLDAQVARGLAHRSTATALTSVEACTVPVSALRSWLGPRNSPSGAFLGLALLEAQAMEREATLARRSAVSKVAGFLLEYWHDQNGDARPIELRHQLIAGLLSLRPETLSRTLARLRREGAIDGRGKVRVLDQLALERLAADRSGALG